MAKKKDIQSDELSPFEIQFIDVWFNYNFNGRLAYKQLRPNVLESTADTEASKILNLPKAQTYIELKKEQIRQREDIKLEFLVNQLQSIILTEDTEEIERDGSGQITKRRTKSNNSARIQAMNLLSKIAGFDAPKKVDITTNGESINKITWVENKQYKDNELNI